MAKKPISHLWIPDTQVREGVDTDHIHACGNYIMDKQPDRIIIAGDWWDMPATSRWNTKLDQEGLRIVDDIEAGRRAMERLWAPLEQYQRRHRKRKKIYNPERHFLFGNHEEHLMRPIKEDPRLEGLFGYDMLGIERWGLKAYPFLEIVELDGISYSHYFCNPSSGRPYGGMMQTRLKNYGKSFTQGHKQEFDYGELPRAWGQIHMGLVAGAFYSHDEDYKIQGNHHWRGVVMKHEVHDGEYDLMKVSLDFLLRRYL